MNEGKGVVIGPVSEGARALLTIAAANPLVSIPLPTLTGLSSGHSREFGEDSPLMKRARAAARGAIPASPVPLRCGTAPPPPLLPNA